MTKKLLFAVFILLMVLCGFYYASAGPSITSPGGTGGGTGDVSVSGTPTNHQWSVWTNSDTIKGVSITASKPVCSDGSGDPAVCAGTEGVWMAAGGNETQVDRLATTLMTGGTLSSLVLGGGNATIDSSGNVLMRTASYIRNDENPFCQQFFAGTNYDDNYTEFCAPNEGYSATTRYVWPVDPPTGNQVMVFPAPTLQVSQGTWGSAAGTGDLVSTNNLSDVSNKATARGNLDVPQAGTLEDGHWCVYATADGINCNQDAPAGGTTAWIVKTSGYTAAAGDKILADSTSAAFTIALPSSPSVGDEVDIADGNGTFGVNNINVNCNGARIMGQDNNATLAINHSLVRFVYFNANKGWLLFE